MFKRIIPVEITYFVIAIWVVFFANTVLIGLNLNQFGIRPRELSGLYGIVLSPFLHAGLYHLISNTLPLLVLGSLLKASVGSNKLLYIMILGAIGSGIGVWCFGSGSVVVGASGMVFALLGFLFSDAIFNPSLRNWLIAIVAFLSYGGALFSLINFLPYVSWAAHFWGFVSGIALSIMLRRKRAD
ncbi:rhomboid family intramembrane serine protease [Marinomonas balearica]|uniref:Membrane associated rhomboid family serine protease n=1 Tax=Marinomonas balearica TaxID=491947 RepID=A0A4R6M9Q9_9GAMM|nr:rhomboid family intramembrane serine protease [Marinomonas balearica]TDO98251.1 membrane associated rhomboid family serine protease [Marinomonas balearica]